MEAKGLLEKKWFFWTLFLALFGYAAIRAWTVVPMLDELATFYSYIRTGHYFNTIELVDANNHVLNSFFGHQFYRFFGNHFFLFRLPSLLSFPVYFFALKYICRTSISKKINVLVFISLVCIPWVFEYFSYSRGYGMAIAFFFAAIAFIIKWKQTGKLVHFTFIFACLLVTVASSLTYVMPSLLLFLFVGLLLVLNYRNQQQKWIFSVLVMLAYLASLVPFIRYSFELKEVGALWWGNQDGLWESTGKSLSHLVLFTEASWVFYLISFLLVFGLVSFVLSWRQKGLWTYLKETEAMIFLVLVGVLTGIVASRYLFDLNYPMDRVAMYLIPLFILFLGMFLSKFQWAKYSLTVLCFFPISFLFHLSVSTSIFSPEDRIPVYFTDHIKATVNERTDLSAEYVSHMSYAYSCRNDKKVHLAYTSQKDFDRLGDYHVDWLGRDSIDGYHSILQDPESHTNFLKKQQSPKRALIADTIIRKVNTTEMYFTVFEKSLDTSLRSEYIQVEITGKMKFDKTTRAFNIIRAIEDENGVASSNSSPQFNWYFGDRTDVNFSFVDRAFELKPNDTNLSLYLLNGDLRKINIEFIRVRIYRVTP